MIDGIKTYDLKVNPNRLEQNPYLAEHWNTNVHNADAVVRYAMAEYLGLKFQIKNQKVRMQGSLHKYRNNGKHNYDDFTVVDVGKVVMELSGRFEIDTQQTELNNVEFGVNVVLGFPVMLVLNNLIHYKGSPFMKVVEDGMIYYQCKKAHFIIKIYDKALQYGLPDNVLRFEVKVIKMQFLKNRGIVLKYLSDLLNVGIYEPLSNILTEVFDNILFGDSTLNESRLSRKELEIYLRASNPKTWEVTAGGQNQSRKLNRLEWNFLNILDKYREGVNFKSKVAELIRAKSLELSTIYRPMDTVLSLENIQKLPTKCQDEKTKNIQKLHFSYSVIPVYSTDISLPTSTKPKRGKSKRQIQGRCASCRAVLKDGQITYCSLKCETDKGGRNEMSNPRNSFKRRYAKQFEEPSLFDVTAFVKLNDRQREWITK